MTEEQAKAMPCVGPASTNTGIWNGDNFLCRGSGCLAWRVGTTYRDGSGYILALSEEEAESRVKDSLRTCGHPGNALVIVRYCGFAGRP